MNAIIKSGNVIELMVFYHFLLVV